MGFKSRAVSFCRLLWLSGLTSERAFPSLKDNLKTSLRLRTFVLRSGGQTSCPGILLSGRKSINLGQEKNSTMFTHVITGKAWKAGQ